MQTNLKGRTAVVTGASMGIGRACAKALAAEGVHLAIVARRTELLDQLADEIVKAGGKRPVIITCDVEVKFLILITEHSVMDVTFST